MYNTTYENNIDLFLTKKKWKPKKGDLYYYVGCEGGIYSRIFEDKHEEKMVDFCNCFRTKDEAEEMAERIKKLLNEK